MATVEHADIIAARVRELTTQRVAMRDPVDWVSHTLGETMWSRQQQIAREVANYTPRIAVPSCHSAGKSMLAAWLVAWWVVRHAQDDSLVITTAPTYAQVQGILWRYIRRTHQAGKLIGRLVESPNQAWAIDGQMVAWGRKPGGKTTGTGSDAEAMAKFQGQHADYLLTILDESCGVPRWLWDAADANATTEHNVILAIGNPDDAESRFAEVCDPLKDAWTTLPISAFDTPAFTGEAVPDKVRNALVQPAWVERAARSWGEDSAMYKAKVLGEFSQGSKDQVIPAAWIAACRYLDAQDIDALNPRGPLPEGAVLGVDVARSEDGDKATIVQKHRGVVKVVWQGQVAPYQEGRVCPPGTVNGVVPGLRDKVAAVATAGGPDWSAVVDGDGVGGPLVDALRAEAIPVHEYRGNGKPKRPDRFLNTRAEAHWELRETIKAKGIALPQSRPGDAAADQLAADLGAPRWHTSNPRSVIQVEKKADIISRIGRSPDLGDACVMACWVPPVQLPDNEAEMWHRRGESASITHGILDQAM